MSTIVKSHLARKGWRELLDRVLKGEDIVIERNGKPTAVLIPYEDYLALAEALDDLRAARRVAEAQKISEQRGRSYDDIREELKRKGLLDE